MPNNTKPRLRLRQTAGGADERARRQSGQHARDSSQHGGVLLAVLWLVAALSVIALTVAGTVRGEVERTTVNTEGTRAYFLAKGAIDRAALYIQWADGNAEPGAAARYYQRGARQIEFLFPTGAAVVDVIPESAKLNVNRASVEGFVRLFVALGLDPFQAQELAVAIDHWRKPVVEPNNPLDAFYLAPAVEIPGAGTVPRPSFAARHASLDNVEELLLVKGMTPELFYGTFVPGSGNSLLWRSGVRDCLTVYTRSDSVDINWAAPETLQALGLPPQAVAAIVARRQMRPFLQETEIAEMGLGGFDGAGRLHIGGRSIYTLRAAARLRRQDGGLSDVQRTVAAIVDLKEPTVDRPFTTLRWYDVAWKQ